MSALQSAVHQGLQYRQFAWSRLHCTNNVKVTSVRYHVPYEGHWLQSGPVVVSQHIQRQQQQQSFIQRRHRHQLTLTPASSSSSSAAGAFNPDGYNLNNSVSSSSSRFLAGLSSLFQSHYLPLALITALLLGVICPGPGVAAAQLKIPAITTFGIFVVQVRRDTQWQWLTVTGQQHQQELFQSADIALAVYDSVACGRFSLSDAVLFYFRVFNCGVRRQ